MLCLVRRWARYGTLLASMTESNGDLPPVSGPLDAVTAFRPLCVEGGLATFKLCLVFRTGEKAGKLFFELHSDCKKVLADICEGKINRLTVFLQKNVKPAAPSDTSEEFLGHQDLHLLRDLRVFGGEVVWPQTSTAKLCSTSWNGFLTFHSKFHVY